MRMRAGEPTWPEWLSAGNKIFIPMCFPRNEHWVSVILWKSEGHQDKFRVLVRNSSSAFYKYDSIIARRMVEMCVASGLRKQWTSWTDMTPTYPHPLEQRPHNLCAVHVIVHAYQVITGQLLKMTTYKDIDTFREFCQYVIFTKNEEVCHDVVGIETIE